ncbi:MAG: sulfotransferase domain-containing protein [Bacteroidia bacterium]|nr:sulfotransferase domain-containing protein [Bacteroidia bacterium]
MSAKIDLFIIGAQKAGTTSLKNYLGEHPEIVTHQSKEFSFFYDDTEYEAGIEKAYEHYFGTAEMAGKKIVCKHAHLYSSEKAIERLKQHNPECMIVFIMRNPVKRTLSSYLMEKLYDRVDFEFDELQHALNGSGELKLEDWQFEAIVEFGFYYNYLQLVYKHFAKEKVKLILFEEFSKHPLRFCTEIFSSFGINNEFQPRVRVVHNKTSQPKSKFFAGFLKRFLVEKNPVKEGIKRVMPSNTSARLGEKLRDANRSKKNNYEMSKEMKIFLENYFLLHNKSLAELTGINLDAWVSSKKEN